MAGMRLVDQWSLHCAWQSWWQLGESTLKRVLLVSHDAQADAHTHTHTTHTTSLTLLLAT